MKKLKEYEVIRIVEEKFYVEAENKEAAFRRCFENGDPAKVYVKSIKAKVLPPIN